MKYTIKWLALVLALALLALAGCGQKDNGPDETPDPDPLDQIQDQVEILSDTMTFCNGSVTLRFQKDDQDVWQWRDEPDFPLNADYPKALLGLVEELLALQPITTEKSLEDLGLDTEEKYITATDELGQGITWYIGESAGNGQVYLRRTANDVDTVYISPAGLEQQISRSIYDMMLLPQLPWIPAEDILSLSVATAAGDIVLNPVSDGKWTSTTAGAAAKVPALLEVLAQPSLNRCLDYKPSSGAVSLCGLDKPAATLEVKYLNSMDVESHFKLRVGKALHGGYCVTINDDSTIYLMDAAMATPLLAFAK